MKRHRSGACQGAQKLGPGSVEYEGELSAERQLLSLRENGLRTAVLANAFRWHPASQLGELSQTERPGLQLRRPGAAS